MENKSYPTKKDIDDTLVDSCKVIVSGIPIFGSPVIEYARYSKITRKKR